MLVWFAFPVRAGPRHSLRRSVEARDFMAAITAVLTHQVIALDQFGRRWLRESLAWFELDNLMARPALR